MMKPFSNKVLYKTTNSATPCLSLVWIVKSVSMNCYSNSSNILIWLKVFGMNDTWIDFLNGLDSAFLFAPIPPYPSVGVQGFTMVKHGVFLPLCLISLLQTMTYGRNITVLKSKVQLSAPPEVCDPYDMFGPKPELLLCQEFGGAHLISIKASSTYNQTLVTTESFTLCIRFYLRVLGTIGTKVYQYQGKSILLQYYCYGHWQSPLNSLATHFCEHSKPTWPWHYNEQRKVRTGRLQVTWCPCIPCSSISLQLWWNGAVHS